MKSLMAAAIPALLRLPYASHPTHTLCITHTLPPGARDLDDGDESDEDGANPLAPHAFFFLSYASPTHTPHSTLPRQARVLDDGDESDEDGANPFAPSAASRYASNPSSRPGTWRGARPSAGAFKA
jgi:hypothetical protein